MTLGAKLTPPRGHNFTLNYKKPCQIGFLLSVRVRVGFRVLNPIKNKFVDDIFLNNSEVPGFRKKCHYTIIKTINIYVIPSTYLCEY